jgi:sRNA-binding regulator protein Hfq
MSIHAIIPHVSSHSGHQPGHAPDHTQAHGQITDRSLQARAGRSYSAPLPFHFPTPVSGEDATYRQAELFYLQKQVQSQTPMVIVLEDGEKIEGCIEWYDRNCLKIRGRAKTLVYKSAIKYMYKVGETGQ